MNKYQQALDIICKCEICNCGDCKTNKSFWVLDELVKKSVPKKVIEIETVYKCPSCDT